MLEDLSSEMQGLFMLAAEISARFKHYYVGVEHIVLAYAQLDEETLAGALEAGGVSVKQWSERLVKFMAEAPTLPSEGRMVLTPRLGRLIEAVRREGPQASEKLLPLMFREGKSLPCRLVLEMGGDLNAIADHLEESPIGASAKAQERLAHARTPSLNALGRDVTRLAQEGKIDPVVGREREIRQVALVLTRKTKNNPVLIGEAGVGKTAVVEGLACRIAAGQVPPGLRDKRIVELPLSVVLAGTQYRGQFEERLTRIVDEARGNPEIILFIDELHTLIGTGSGGGTLDAANILKPALARGDLRCIGATTITEYNRHIEKDAALERRFTPVTVRELSSEATIAVLEGRRSGYEAHHGVSVSREAIETAVRLAARYMPNRRMPDKALDLLDEACARANIASFFTGDATQWGLEPQARGDEPRIVSARDVADVLADRMGLPVERLLEGGIVAVAGLEDALRDVAVGQEDAVRRVVATLRREKRVETARPVSFIFAGPTGSGKRALARGLANALFGEEMVVSFDLAEFTDKIDVEKLLGAPPAYIGHETESLLSQRLRREPYAVVVLEHFGLGYSGVQDLFLRAISEGQVSDNQGRTIHFRNFVLIVAADLDAPGRPGLGFAPPARGVVDDEAHETAIKRQLRDLFSQSIVDAVDAVVLFDLLDQAALQTLAEQGLERLAAEVGRVVFESEVTVWLATEAASLGTGRQALERLIETEVADVLHERLAVQPLGGDETLVVSREEGKLTLVSITGVTPIPQ
jgi:ATP-dependent Clp protease ATP-binding subunit ClpC